MFSLLVLFSCFTWIKSLEFRWNCRCLFKFFNCYIDWMKLNLCSDDCAKIIYATYGWPMLMPQPPISCSSILVAFVFSFFFLLGWRCTWWGGKSYGWFNNVWGRTDIRPCKVFYGGCEVIQSAIGPLEAAASEGLWIHRWCNNCKPNLCRKLHWKGKDNRALCPRKSCSIKSELKNTIALEILIEDQQSGSVQWWKRSIMADFYIKVSKFGVNT